MSWQRTYKATQARLQNANAKNDEIVSAESMLAASYYTGAGFQTVKNIVNMTGRRTQSRSTFFRRQIKCEPKLISKANELEQEACKSFSGDLALDCRWSSKVRGIHGTVTAVDGVTKKVLADATLTKFGGSRPNGNFQGSSNSMETEGTKLVFKTLQERGIVDQIDTVSKDRDNKNKKLYNNYKLNNKIAFDPGHFRNSFTKALTKMINDNKRFRYVTTDNEEVIVNNPFDSLEGRLLRWFNTCLKEENDDKRLSMWLSTVPHYLGDHSCCLHDANEIHQVWMQGIEHEPLIDVLNNLIDNFADDIGRTSVYHSTQCVESVNSMYSRVAPKMKYWNKIDGRIAAGIIRQNDPVEAPFIISEC